MASATKPKPPLSSLSAPPSKINVHKFAESRAAELESLHAVVASRLGDDFRSKRSKRRRTTAFDREAAGRRRKAPRRDPPEPVRVSRRTRRRRELMKNPEKGFSLTGDGTRRLRTHVWHAKRFAMAKRWGYCLPIGLHGSGRGSRALLKRFRDGVLIHDASYYVPVQLEGSEVSLSSVLSSVLTGFSGAPDSVITGVSYGSAMLHHRGEQSSQAIAPVTYMWRPSCSKNSDDKDVSSVTDEPKNPEPCSSFRQLWVWIHASAFAEGYDVLKVACQKEMDERGNSVTCISLEGQLAKLEVMGLKALELLQKTLTVASISPTSEEKVDDFHIEKTNLNDSEALGSSKAMLYACVVDPRAMTKKKPICSVPESTSGDIVVDFSLWSEACDKSTLACTSVWNVSSGVIPPLEESVLCNEKHEQRNSLFYLKSSVKTELQSSRCCPIMLLRNESDKSRCIGWSVILPMNWVKTFWVPLVSNGGHAIGLREKHWVACEVGLPSFPSDFPDCNAHSSLKAAEDSASSLPQPWDCVRFTLNRLLKRTVDPEINRTIEVSERDGTGTSFDGFVARTPCLVNSFLNEIRGSHLLVFPQVADKKMCFPDITKDESKLGFARNRLASIDYNHKLCFVRVLLHAYKEGAFEEGAVICVPHLSDINLWTSSESINEGLQIPASTVSTFFKEHSSDESVASESHRSPLGFVTTGFVRGSKKPVAEALCEAVLLAHLRNEQWSDSFVVKRRRKEIFVLVRNLKSTAYRLALATIVLEKEVDDLGFL